jgi:hypothetical protein
MSDSPELGIFQILSRIHCPGYYAFLLLLRLSCISIMVGPNLGSGARYVLYDGLLAAPIRRGHMARSPFHV